MDDQAAQVMPVVVVLPAEIDVTNSEQVYGQLVAALAPGVHTVIADMMATVFCDSSGVHAIMHAYETAGRARCPDATGRVVGQLRCAACLS